MENTKRMKGECQENHKHLRGISELLLINKLRVMTGK